MKSNSKLPSIFKVITCFSILIFSSFLLFQLNANADTAVILPYGASGYRYKIIELDEPTPSGFEAPDFDDTDWAIGDAAFGITTDDATASESGSIMPEPDMIISEGKLECCWIYGTVKTTWPIKSQLLVRKDISIPSGATNVRVMVAVDNDIIGIYFNGISISDPIGHEGCPCLDTFCIEVPPYCVQEGQNKVVFHVRDRGYDSFFDTRILADTDSSCISLSVSPDILWPPNHKMVLITPTIEITGNCASDSAIAESLRLESITMNEGDEFLGDGNTVDDIQVDENGDIYLRAERSGLGIDRIYTITYTATDSSGNEFSASATVTVPHDYP